MADTGFCARRIHAFVQAKLCQRLNWHCPSPFTPVDSCLSFSCPIVPLLIRWGWRSAAVFCAVQYESGRMNNVTADFFYAVPCRSRKCNGRKGRKNGSIGHLYTAWPANASWPYMRRGGRDTFAAAPNPIRNIVKVLISRVTTPTHMGAFFRNQGGSIPLTLPRMEEETQGVTPPFNEEVAWGRGGSLYLA